MLRRVSSPGPWVALIASLGLTACGGGGDSPGGGVVTPLPPFTWNNVLKPGATVTVQGKAATRTYSSTSQFPTANGYSATTKSDASFTETLSSAGAITNLQLSNGTETVSFSTAAGDTIGQAANGAIIVAQGDRAFTNLSGGPASAVAANPTQLGWDYQSFGVWSAATMVSIQSISYVGAASVGAVTPDSAIPTTGVATFQGQAGGIYVGSATVGGYVAASVTLKADFAAHTADFATTTFTDVNTGAAYAGTALHGAMTYAAGVNALSGGVTTANGALTGTVDGRFYGPAAQEVGGLFTLDGPLNQYGRVTTQLIGAYGAKR